MNKKFNKLKTVWFTIFYILFFTTCKIQKTDNKSNTQNTYYSQQYQVEGGEYANDVIIISNNTIFIAYGLKFQSNSLCEDSLNNFVSDKFIKSTFILEHQDISFEVISKKYSKTWRANYAGKFYSDSLVLLMVSNYLDQPKAIFTTSQTFYKCNK